MIQKENVERYNKLCRVQKSPTRRRKRKEFFLIHPFNGRVPLLKIYFFIRSRALIVLSRTLLKAFSTLGKSALSLSSFYFFYFSSVGEFEQSSIKKQLCFVNYQREIMRLSCGAINTSFEYNSPKDFLQSQWQKNEKSAAYVIYRWIVASFYIFSVTVSLIKAGLHDNLPYYLIYLTHWNLVFTTFSMVWSACLATSFYRGRLNVNKRMTKSLKFYWFLSTSSNMYAVMVSLIYWCILYHLEHNVIDLNNVVVHCTNSLVLFINLAVVKQPERFGLFLYPLCCGFIYLFFTWLYPYFGGKNR